MLELDPSENHWILDPQNNGYYVASGQNLTFGYRKQPIGAPWRDKDFDAYYAIAYLDHGVQPTDAHYTYVIQVEVTAVAMKTLSKQMQSKNPSIRVLQRSEDAHVVYDAQTRIWAAAYFEPSKPDVKDPITPTLSPVISVDRSCLIMAEPEGGKTWHLAIANPGFKHSLPVDKGGRWNLVDCPL